MCKIKQEVFPNIPKERMLEYRSLSWCWNMKAILRLWSQKIVIRSPSTLTTLFSSAQPKGQDIQSDGAKPRPGSSYAKRWKTHKTTFCGKIIKYRRFRRKAISHKIPVLVMGFDSPAMRKALLVRDFLVNNSSFARDNDWQTSRLGL